MSIFTSKKVWKFLIKIQLTKYNPKRTRGWKVPSLMPIRVNQQTYKILNTTSNRLWPNCEVDQNLLFAFYALLPLLVLVVHLRRQLFPRQFSPGPIVQLQNLFDKLRLVPFKIMDFFISGQNFSNYHLILYVLQNKKDRMLLKWQTVDYRE